MGTDGKKGMKTDQPEYAAHYAHGNDACIFNGYDVRGIDHGYGDRYTGVVNGQGAPAIGRGRRFAQFDGAYFGFGSHGHVNDDDHQLSYRSAGVYGGPGGHDYFSASELSLCLQVELCQTCCGSSRTCSNDFEA